MGKQACGLAAFLGILSVLLALPSHASFRLSAALLAVMACLLSASLHASENDPFAWVPVRQEARPWVYWWWLGSAVTEAEISRHLSLFRQVGLGGAHIIPIYGAQGAEERYIPFLSSQWLQMLAHTLQEGERLDIGVDMTLGTGWNLGGPWVDETTAAKRVLIRTFTLRSGEQLREPLFPDQPYAILHALVAYSSDGQVIDLAEKVDLQTKQLHWSPPQGEWKIYAVFQILHGMKVKRAAPGGEGYVMDFFSRRALMHYLTPFNKAFRHLNDLTDLKVRAIYHDSFEVMGENWTDNLLDEFRRRRGYDLRHYLPALVGDAPSVLVTRVRSDFRQTIDELMLEEYALPWVGWAHQHGFLVRYEAHGSPGNLLDLYAAADIPESELFGPDCLQLAGLRPLRGDVQRGRSDPRTLFLFLKFASSAAHVTGKRLCANETATWLGEHFCVPLEHVKAQADLLFLAGINHIFYHGIPFSPEDAPWPGWLFYASTHFGPTNTFWEHFPALNNYIARCQSFLQLGQPDNNLLLYFPVFDLWATEEGTRGYLHFLIANGEWLERNLPAFTQAALHLWERGYSFDFVSDRMLAKVVTVAENALQTPISTYRALLLAHCRLIPVDTFERILQLTRQGATVLVLGDLPQDVPGLSNLSERQQRLSVLRSQVEQALRPIAPNVKEAQIGKGRFLLSHDLPSLLAVARIPREPMTDWGLRFIRRKESHERFVYFIVNLGSEPFEGWVPLGVPAKAAVLFDPMHERCGLAAVRQRNDAPEIYLQLSPRQSVIVRTLMREVKGLSWDYWKAEDASFPLEGVWQVEFVEGGPCLPKPTEVRILSSWTEWNHDDPNLLKAFSGTARYRLMFDLPSTDADAWWLDLGTVCYSARVWLNERLMGTLIAAPFRILVTREQLKPKDNKLVVEVANLMANRIADMDKRGVPWQQFFFVNIRYQPFSAADWEPLPSGLLGPVRLVPLRRFVPADGS